jgi:hypothetical protein
VCAHISHAVGGTHPSMQIIDEEKKYVDEPLRPIEAMQHIRKMMCKENDPPINEAIHAGQSALCGLVWCGVRAQI